MIIARAAAGAAKAAKSAATAPSKTLRTIRQRYTRQAERLEKKASQFARDDFSRELYMQEAQRAREKAESLKIKNLTPGLKRGSTEYRSMLEDVIAQEEEASYSALSRLGGATVRDEIIRKEAEGRRILSGSRGSAFYAATRPLWSGIRTEGGKADISAINSAINKAFGTTNILDALNKLSELTGVDFSNVSTLDAREQYKLAARAGLQAVLQLQVK